MWCYIGKGKFAIKNPHPPPPPQEKLSSIRVTLHPLRERFLQQHFFKQICMNGKKIDIFFKTSPAKTGILQDNKKYTPLGHWVENLFIAPLPSKSLLCGHKICLRKILFHFFRVIQLFALFTGVICKVQGINHFRRDVQNRRRENLGIAKIGLAPPPLTPILALWWIWRQKRVNATLSSSLTIVFRG